MLEASPFGVQQRDRAPKAECGSAGEQVRTGGRFGFKQNKVLWKPFMYLSCLCYFEGPKLPPESLGWGFTGVGSAGAVCMKQFWSGLVWLLQEL